MARNPATAEMQLAGYVRPLVGQNGALHDGALHDGGPAGAVRWEQYRVAHQNLLYRAVAEPVNDAPHRTGCDIQ